MIEKFTINGKILMLAFDHRGSFKKAMQAETQDQVTDDEIIDLKFKILKALDKNTSGVLIDQEYGLPAFKKLNNDVPYLLPMEKSGYTDAQGERLTELAFNAKSIIANGALGAKLLLYTNVNSDSWNKQMETAKVAIADCKENNIPIFLEFVLYELEGKPAGTVVENVAKAISEGVLPDVWKIAYPGSEDECKKMSEVAGNTPWILLTAGGTFEDFKNQFTIANGNGASGFLAGRALWQEAIKIYKDEEKLNAFLDNELGKRFVELVNISEN